MAKNFSHPLETAEMPKFNDRQIYNDAIALQYDPQNAHPGYAMPRANVKKSKRNKAKTTNIVALFFGFAIVGLLYIGNVLAVNTLAKEIGDLQAQYNSIVSTNEVLKAEISKKESLERISLMAQEKLGMVNPKAQPVWFEVSTEKIQEVKEQAQR